MASIRLLSSLLAVVAALAVPTSEAGKTSDPFYVIAHMANSRQSLDWSVKEGANAIEADIAFDGSGNPTKFEHGGFCDCSCPHPRSYHICSAALHGCSGSGASEAAGAHLQHLARLPGVALLIMDGKVDPKWGGRLKVAGRKVVELLERDLFGRGYQGKVVVSAGKINSFEYVYAAALAAAGGRNAGRYYFSFDQEGNNYRDVAAMLSRFTRRRVFGTGISSCVPGSYRSGISQAVAGVSRGEMGLAYIWTLDKESSMRTYINLGVQGVITNRVGLLRKLANQMGLRLARVGDTIPVARVDVSGSYKCDCDYHKGGCTISMPAPVGHACRCKYKGFWTCGGSVTSCSMSHSKCSRPDASYESCRLGGGDCGGY